MKFKRRFGNVGIDAVRTRVLLPGYTFPGKVTRLQDANNNAYVRLGSDASVTTAAFAVDNNTQITTVDMIGLTTLGDQYRIEVLSGATCVTVTKVAVSTNAPDTWQPVQLNLGAWQGQSIKLRITSLYGAVGIDDIALQQNIAPHWQVTDTPFVLTEGNGNRYLSTNGTLTSAAFTLASDMQQISLRHRGSGATNSFLVKLLRGPDFNQEIDLTTGSVGSAIGNWQTYKVALNLYAGETVKLKLLRNAGRIEFDDVAVGENVLPGWRVNTHKAITTGEDSFGSYVTTYDGGAFIIRSSEITAQ